jgi:integrase
METAITRPPTADLAQLARRAEELIRNGKSPATIRAYRWGWRHFVTWCEENGREALPASPETVALYLAGTEASAKIASLQLRLVAIGQAHKTARLPNPAADELVTAAWQGLRREKGTAPLQKAPAMKSDLKAMVETLPDSLAGIRDRAILLVGFAGAFRRSELVALDMADVEFTTEGMVITVRRSKTDQEGQGHRKAIPMGLNGCCPVRALRRWLEASGIEGGPLFRGVDRHGHLQPERLSGQSVALVVKKAAAAAGLDATNYSGHSLRAGLATSAAAAGASERAIMAQTGHRNVQMVRRYIREADLFRENAAAAVGL